MRSHARYLLALTLPTSGCALVASTVAGAAADSAASEENAADAELDNVPLPKGTGPRKRIGIVAFEDASGGSRWGQPGSLAEVAADATMEVLHKSEAFVIVERAQIVEVLKEQGFGMTGAVHPQAAAKAGQLLGLQAILTGKITDFDQSVDESANIAYSKSRRRYKARVSLKLIDATTGEIWVAESGEGAASETSAGSAGGGSRSYDENLGKRALYRAIHSAAAAVVQAANKRTWSAQVARIKKNKVYIVAGSSSGLAPGAELKVRRLGEKITDPATGQVLGRELGKVLGSIQVAKHLNEKLTLCIRSSGGGFSAGDMVFSIGEGHGKT